MRSGKKLLKKVLIRVCKSDGEKKALPIDDAVDGPGLFM